MTADTLREKIQSWFNERNVNAMQFLQGEVGLISDNATSLEEVDRVDLLKCHGFIFCGEMERLLREKTS